MALNDCSIQGHYATKAISGGAGQIILRKIAPLLILLREYPAEVSLNTLILLRFYSFLF
ncbi:hypothetical protein [Pantoea sp. WEP]|uniref:hypothetical protein n=1 Tax=Pantoea sp. WEP TaxID=3230025 RepID=UPI0035660DFB